MYSQVLLHYAHLMKPWFCQNPQPFHFRQLLLALIEVVEEEREEEEEEELIRNLMTRYGEFIGI